MISVWRGPCNQQVFRPTCHSQKWSDQFIDGLNADGHDKQSINADLPLSCRDIRRDGSKLPCLRISIPSRILPTNIRPPHQALRSSHSPLIGSDNGGSTSEISRVIGGPGIGDIRSRLIRLMNDATPEQSAIKKLMSYRLSVEDGNQARMEWLQIVEGTHSTSHPLPRHRRF